LSLDISHSQFLALHLQHPVILLQIVKTTAQNILIGCFLLLQSVDLFQSTLDYSRRFASGSDNITHALHRFRIA